MDKKIMRRLTFVSSLVLAIYCGFGLYLPTFFEADLKLTQGFEDPYGDKYAEAVEQADKEELRAMVNKMLQYKFAKNDQGRALADSLADLYIDYFQILAALLLVHFSCLFGYVNAPERSVTK